MFGLDIAAYSIHVEIAKHRLRDLEIETAREKLPNEQFTAYMGKRLAQEAAAQIEAAKERRHQEVCEAIRASRFRFFG